MQHTIVKPNFETVWATLQEVAQMHKEIAAQQKETDRIVKENAERQKETERIIKENARENDRIIKDNARKLGKLDARFGEVVEYMVAPNLQNKFRELGLDFHRLGPNFSIEDHKNNVSIQPQRT